MRSNQIIDKLKDYDFLRAILTNLPAVAFVIAPDGTVLFAEGKGIVLAGLKREDVLGTNVSNYFSCYPGFDERLHRVLEGEEIASTVIAPNGRSLEVTYSPMRDDQGSICGVIGVAQDITEREKTEQELRDSEEKFRCITSAATDAIIMMDQRGRISLWNDSAQMMFGYTEQEAIGQDLHFLVAPQRYHDQTMMESFTSRGESPLPGKVLELTAKRKSGEEFSLELSLSTFRLHDQWHAVGTARDITARKEAERQLRESEEKFSRAFQSNAALMAITDIRTKRFIDVNETFVKVLGFTRDEAVGKTAAELQLFVDIGRRQTAANEVEKGRSVRNFEATVRAKSGELRYGIFSAEKIILQGADCMMTVMVDITERKQAEEALRESQEVLQAVLNSIPVRVFWKDKNSRFLGCNTPFARDAGFEKPEDIIGKDDRAMGWREQAELYRADDRGVIESGNAKLHIEEPQTTPSGEQIHLLTSKVPLRDVGGAIVGVLGTYQDITERKRAEQALRESENAYRAIFENTGSATVIIEADTIISLVNSEFERLAGYAREEIEGKMSWTQFVVPEDLDMMAARHRLRRERPNATPTAYEFRLRDRSGAIKHILLNVVMIAGTGKSVASLTNITERKRIEEALRTSESAYRAIFKNTGTATMIVEEDTTITLVNSEFEKLTGYTKTEVEGKMCWTEFTVKEEVDRMLDQHRLRRIDPNAALKSYEFQLLGKDGVATDVLMTVDIIPGTGQSVASCLDITERKEAERELRESEEKFSRAFQSGAALMSITEVDTDIFIDVNNAFLKTMGFTRDEVIGKTVRETGTIAEPARFADAKQEFADNKYLRDHEMTVRTKSGDLLYGIFSSDKIVIGGKNCLLTVMTDITKRRLAEQALCESENTYRAIFENTGNATMIIEGDTTISLVNSEFEKLTGYTKEETEGKMRWTKLVVEEDIDRMLDQHRLRRTDSSAALKSYEFRMRIKNGMVKDILLSIDLIPGTARSIASFTDITERKRAEAEREQLQRQLQQSQKLEAIGTMAGGIAHDFNNILTGILGFTELVCSEVPEDSEIYENLAEVMKAGRRARDLVRQILSFSRRAETEKSLISLVTIVKDALKLIRSVTPSHISIKQNLTASPARAILADPTQMHQVVLNLCINAADAMPDGGVLEISVEEVRVETESRPERTQLPSGCYLKLTVRDNGTGMPAEVQERIFEPYFTTKQVGKGTGMGLAVVHGVIKDHGGSIAVSSDPGKGTVFEICLPVVEASLDSEIESAPVVAAGCESILFVDDETMITNLQRSQLGKWGYRVTATENSATALGIFRGSPRDFDLVITDQSMPGLTGVKLAQAIHEISPSTPIILCTGFDEGISRENTRAIGIHAILTKPITGAEFSRTIRMVLDEASKPAQAKS